LQEPFHFSLFYLDYLLIVYPFRCES
jgi:hypothetical protein